MEKDELKHAYEKFMEGLQVCYKRKSITKYKRPRAICSVLEVNNQLMYLGYSLLGAFDSEYTFSQLSSEDVLLKIYSLLQEKCEKMGMDFTSITQVVKMTKKQSELFRKGLDIKLTTLIQICNKLNIDITGYTYKLTSLGCYVTDKQVRLICDDLSRHLKSKRLQRGIKLKDISYSGNISTTTAHRIEHCCGSVGIKKLITYMTILGFDVMSLLGKVSSSYDADIRIIEFYNRLASYRAASEIDIKVLASRLNIPEEKIQRCENYRADINTDIMIRWLVTLDVFTDSYRNI